jgi:MFS superfamily sulfate permease-like transporter
MTEAAMKKGDKVRVEDGPDVYTFQVSNIECDVRGKQLAIVGYDNQLKQWVTTDLSKCRVQRVQ